MYSYQSSFVRAPLLGTVEHYLDELMPPFSDVFIHYGTAIGVHAGDYVAFAGVIHVPEYVPIAHVTLFHSKQVIKLGDPLSRDPQSWELS